ncbi:flagellar motor switch protein FliM [Lysinimonas soli]|uniref:Flagellar motor switch protein FliM n=1 Tax=Lysinimonas soli TaxID=1074233 RepID=A0ABW0NPQ6_9MICO
MTVQVSGDATARTATPAIEVYDFQRPTTLGREKMRALALAFDNFSRQWATQLTAMTHAVAHVEVESVDVERYGEYADALPDQTTMVILRVAELSSRAVLQLGQDVALGWVGRMLGGDASIPAPARPFTPIESAILGRLIGYLLEDLAYSLGALLDGTLGLDNIQFSSQMAQAARTGQFMLVARFVVAIGDAISPATVAIPLEGLADPSAATSRSAGIDRTRVQLAPVPVSFSLRLRPATVGPADILGLAEGELIRLPHPQHRPLDVAVDGVTVAGAAVGANGSRLACVIVSLEEQS